MADAQRDLRIVISSDSSTAESGLSSFGNSLSRVGEIAAGLGLERLAEQISHVGIEATKFAIDYAINLQQARIAYDAFTGSAQRGGEALKAVTEFARKTPFQLPEVVEAGQQLLGFGFTIKDLLPKLNEVGALAMATHTPMQVAIDLFARAREGMFNLREFGQFGISREALEQFGVSFTKAGEAIDKSALLPALEKLIQSRFGNVLAEESRTLGGTISNIKDDLGRLASAMIGVDPSTGTAIKGGLFEKIQQGAQSFLSWLDSHQAQIVAAFNSVVAGITQAFNAALPLLKGAFNLIITFFSDVENRKAAVVATLTVIGVAFAGLAVSVIAATWPVLATLAAVGLAVFVMKEAWDKNINHIQQIVAVFADVFTGQWGKLWVDAKALFFGKIDEIVEKFTAFKDFALGIINGIMDGIRNAANAITGASNKAPQKRALGGYASGLTLVGERGPELVNLPSGSYVHTNEQSKGMMGGIAVTINNPSVRNDSDITALVEQVRRVLGREVELAKLGAF